MSALRIELNGVKISPFLIDAVSQKGTFTKDHEDFPTSITLSGLEDWSTVQSDFITLVDTLHSGDTSKSAQITFTVI